MRHPTPSAPSLLLAGALLLGGCSQSASTDDAATPTASPSASSSSPSPTTSSPSPTESSASPTPEPSETGPAPEPTPETPSPRPSLTASETSGATRVPSAFRAAWTTVEDGDEQVTAADCERGGATAGRVIEITSRRIEYFENSGTLRRVLDSSADSFRGRFAFPDLVNDGPDRVTDIDLTLRQGGEVLVVGSEDSSTTTYRRCPA